LDVPAQAVR
jgi:uncharacterized C2H2 Zn-finger protein